MLTGTYNPAELFEIFGESDGRELLRLAAGDLRLRLDTLAASLATGDLSNAARATHSMAGVAGNISANTLSDLSREAEGRLQAGGALSGELRARIEEEAAAVLELIDTVLAA